MPTVDIYIGAVKDFSDFDQMPAYMEEKLKKIKNQQSVVEKKAGYGLLHHAVGNIYDIKKCYLSKTGKPLHKDFCFSVSHSSGLVAVAVSSSPVGIDIEKCDRQKRTDKLIKKILHENEKDNDSLVLWTVKEAAFKFTEKEKIFIPSSIDTTKFNSKTVKFTWNGTEYILSVVSYDLTDVNFHFIPDIYVKLE